MSDLKLGFSACIVALALAASAANAAPVALDFEFDGVSGSLFGLDNSITSEQSATSYDFFGFLGTYENITNGFTENRITFNAFGELSAIDFVAGPPVPFGPPGVYLTSLNLQTGSASSIEVSTSLFGFDDFSVPRNGAANYAVSETSQVPLPAGGLLLLTGLAAAGGLGYRKERPA